ncbi:hypothetical protein O0I10_000416 [Lichtheimia ornata]|uniref:glucan endo-1,3-beta-D-glucosidase n=1 Tax=Lichtheimia ornata TaxID=688661 RepID=A0AAD7Y5M6_9FUNG|nr:uncharacterized protein O0I10_000416 [Lichtheimia ornata]KAJ8664137.1 hypothetical protein O0I10_000416 [Lichtheimia ornata]
MDQEKQLHPPAPDQALEQVAREQARSKRTSYVIKGCTIALLLVIIAALVALPQMFGGSTNNDDNNNRHHDNTASSPPPPPPPPVPSPHPSGPNTTIIRDTRLHQSFYGMDYTPHGSQYYEGCGVTLDAVLEDIKIMSQLTTRVRLYGMDCDQAGLVVQAIKLLRVDMGVMLTLWVDGNSTTYQRQYNTFWKFLQDHGADHVLGVSVGNEAVYRRQMEASDLITLMQDVKQRLKSMGLEQIPVFTTEIRDLKHLIPHEDAVLDNVHPFFAGTRPEDAADWTWQYFYDVDQYPTLIDAKGRMQETQAKPAIISEIGWPTEPAAHRVKGAVPSIANQQTLLDTFVCQANQRQLPYYWFEFKDQPWKAALFNETRESYWGLFDKDLNLKPSRIPKCNHNVHSWQKGKYTVPQPAPLPDKSSSKSTP